jgi:hypothetical protein
MSVKRLSLYERYFILFLLTDLLNKKQPGEGLLNNVVAYKSATQPVQHHHASAGFIILLLIRVVCPFDPCSAPGKTTPKRRKNDIIAFL